MVRAAAVTLVYVMISAMLLNLLFSNLGSFHEPGLNFFAYLELRTEKPFAYRVLIPDIAGAIESVISPNLPQKFAERFIKGSSLITAYMKLNAGDTLGLSASVKYHIAYLIEFASIFSWLLGARAVACHFLPNNRSLATVVPLVLAAVVPILFTSNQGSLYDYPELAFLTWILYAAIRQNLWLFTLLYPVAILNKESAVLTIIYFVAFLPKWSRVQIGKLGFPIALGVLCFVFSHWQVRHNPGGSVQHHLADNLTFFTNPKSYFLFFEPVAPYIYVPRGYNFILLGLIGWACISRRTERPRPLLLATVGMGACNAVLMLFFGQRDEIRNFTLTLPLIYASGLWLVNAPPLQGSRNFISRFWAE